MLLVHQHRRVESTASLLSSLSQERHAGSELSALRLVFVCVGPTQTKHDHEVTKAHARKIENQVGWSEEQNAQELVTNFLHYTGGAVDPRVASTYIARLLLHRIALQHKSSAEAARVVGCPVMRAPL